MPLSLSDIIAFESDLPGGVVAQPAAAPERRVDDIISRASRVLSEVNMLLEDGRAHGEGSQVAAAEGSSGAPPPEQEQEQAAPPSELSRAIFGGSAQVSEREAARTRQALQRSLGLPPSPVGGGGGAVGGGGREAAGPGPGSSQGAARGPGGSASSSSSTPESGSGLATAPGAATEADPPAWAAALFAPGSGASQAASSSQAASASQTSGSSAPSASTSCLSSPSAAASPAPGQRPPSSSASSSSSAASGSSSPPASSSSSSSPSLSSAAAGPQRASAPAGPAGPAPTPALPQRQQQQRRGLSEWAPLAFAEADLSVPTELRLKSEESLLSERALSAALPPLQSVLELTSAARPPSRGGADAPAAAAEAVKAVSAAVSEDEVLQGSSLGRRLEDGAGRLADGTRFEKLSGTDTGPDGYVKQWEVLRGVTGDGRVQWEECWWQASNRYGLRELGALKKGASEGGAQWVEEWKEVLYTHPDNMRLAIERSAHKWARDEAGDEWEEKWGESYEEAGRVAKWADKWAKAGANVWHERWGEDYDGRGACQKWTDKWAERLLPGGGQEQWGDKWTETFGHGKGTKHGEVWSSAADGSRYNRWWNEEHFGDGRVRKWGNSTSGEWWDGVESMDTYYNPVPHFGFHHAVSHSPQLWAVPLPTPEEGGGGGGDDDGLGVGLGRL